MISLVCCLILCQHFGKRLWHQRSPQPCSRATAKAGPWVKRTVRRILKLLGSPNLGHVEIKSFNHLPWRSPLILLSDLGLATQDQAVKVQRRLHFYVLSRVRTTRKRGEKSKSGLLSQAVCEQSSCEACFLVTAKAKEEQKYFLSLEEEEIRTCCRKASFVRWKVKLKIRKCF